MKLTEIQDLITIDSKIDNSALDTESLKVPYLHSKWLNILIDESRQLRHAEREFNKVKKERIKYFIGDAPDEVYEKEPKPKKVLKQDLDLYLNADNEFTEAQEKFSELQSKVELIEQFIKQITQRSFNIKNAIDFLRFKNGIN